MPERKTAKLVLTHFYPEVNALTNRVEALLPIIARDWNVTIVYLLQPGQRFDSEATEKAFPDLVLNFVPVRADFVDRGNFLKRSFGETVNSLRLWRAARRVKTEILFQSIPQLMLLFVSLFFVPFDTAKTKILEVRDLTWEYVDFTAIPAGSLLAWVFEKVAVLAISRFDEVVTCTEGQAEFVRDHTDRRVYVVRNGISLDKFEQLAAVPSPAGSGRTVISYFGTFGHAQNLITFVHAAEKLRDRTDIQFVMVGAGPEEDKIKEYQAARALTNIEITGKVCWDRLIEYFGEATILYAQLKKGDEFKTAEPSKLFEYFATGKPVIYGGEGLGKKLAEEFENVRVVEPDNVDDLVAAIEDLESLELSRSVSNRNRIRLCYVREAIFKQYLEEAGHI